MNRPPVEDLMRLTANPDSPWGMADIDAQNICRWVLVVEAELAKWREIEKLIGEAAGHSAYASWPVIVTVQNLREELTLRTAEVTALKAANEEMRGRLEKAERVVEAAQHARKLARPWIDKCIGAPSMTMDEWLKVDDDLQNALAVYSKET